MCRKCSQPDNQLIDQQPNSHRQKSRDWQQQVNITYPGSFETQYVSKRDVIILETDANGTAWAALPASRRVTLMVRVYTAPLMHHSRYVHLTARVLRFITKICTWLSDVSFTSVDKLVIIRVINLINRHRLLLIVRIVIQIRRHIPEYYSYESHQQTCCWLLFMNRKSHWSYYSYQ